MTIAGGEDWRQNMTDVQVQRLTTGREVVKNKRKEIPGSLRFRGSFQLGRGEKGRTSMIELGLLLAEERRVRSR